MSANMHSPDDYMKQSGNRRACPHPAHRFPTLPHPERARVILPACAGPAAWLAARQGGIGGSEIGALMGLSEYETPFSVWNTKINGEKDLSDVPAVEWGHRLEEVVAAKTADEVGNLTHRFGGGLWAARDRDILRVTPDRFATRPRSWKAVGVIECKTAGDDADWRSGSITRGGQGDGAAPMGYQAQVQWQRGILGLERGRLGGLVLGRARALLLVGCGGGRRGPARWGRCGLVVGLDHPRGPGGRGRPDGLSGSGSLATRHPGSGAWLARVPGSGSGPGLLRGGDRVRPGLVW